MKEYIDRVNLIKNLNKFVPERKSAVDLIIGKEPVEDVSLIKHGKWVYNGEYNLPKCSLCNSVSHSAVWGSERAYCGHCGAKMDLEG